MGSLDVEEKRRCPRYPWGQLATIKRGDGYAPCYCRVTDISAEGVRIYANGLELPDELVLFFPRNADVIAKNGTYRVVWRHGPDVGAMFISAVTA
jgi:PilZ domain